MFSCFKVEMILLVELILVEARICSCSKISFTSLESILAAPKVERDTG